MPVGQSNKVTHGTDSFLTMVFREAGPRELEMLQRNVLEELNRIRQLIEQVRKDNTEITYEDPRYAALSVSVDNLTSNYIQLTQALNSGLALLNTSVATLVSRVDLLDGRANAVDSRMNQLESQLSLRQRQDRAKQQQMQSELHLQDATVKTINSERYV